MKKLMLAAMLVVAPTAHAGVYGDAMGKCLVSASSDAEKQRLMEWIFSAIALNPAIAPYVTLSAGRRDEIDTEMAGIFERLVGEACRSESSEAIRYEGAAAFGEAFQLLGQVAGQQLFASPEVSVGAQKFQAKIDMDALQEKLDLPADAP